MMSQRRGCSLRTSMPCSPMEQTKMGRCFSSSTAARQQQQGQPPRPFPFDAIFVINLDSRPDRWAHITNELAGCGLPPRMLTRLPAVVGADCSVERLVSSGYVSSMGRQRMGLPRGDKIWGMDLSPGAIGCAMSHFQLWARIAMMKCECALVIEDDSLFPKNFLQDVAERWRWVPHDWELVYLSGLDTAKKGHLLPVEETPAHNSHGDDGMKVTNPWFRHVHQFHRTTNCYALNHVGASALLDVIPPLTFQLDTEMTIRTKPHPRTGEPFAAIPTCYTMHPPLVVQATRFGSDIQDGNPADPVEEELSRIAEAQWGK